jgi:hypothetical protein
VSRQTDGILLDSQGQGPYSLALKKIEAELKDIQKRIDEKMGVKESDTGLARPDMWDLMADKVRGDTRACICSLNHLANHNRFYLLAKSRRTPSAGGSLLQDYQGRFN